MLMASSLLKRYVLDYRCPCPTIVCRTAVSYDSYIHYCRYSRCVSLSQSITFVSRLALVNRLWAPPWHYRRIFTITAFVFHNRFRINLVYLILSLSDPAAFILYIRPTSTLACCFPSALSNLSKDQEILLLLPLSYSSWDLHLQLEVCSQLFSTSHNHRLWASIASIATFLSCFSAHIFTSFYFSFNFFQLLQFSQIIFLHFSAHIFSPFLNSLKFVAYFFFFFRYSFFAVTSTIMMVNSFNTLLDSGCVRHVVRDRALFCEFVEKSISVGTATYGSLDALGSGDVEFRHPFGDRFVTFTLRGCLYAPTAPMNLLSVGVLVERGMSCLFLPGGITKVFFPDQHPTLLGLAFSPTVANHLSFLLLDFVSPVASSVTVPVAFPAWVSPPAAVAPSQSAFFPSSSSSHRKPNSPPKKKLPFTTPHYLVIDATLPSHIFHDCSLFTMYVPSRRLHRNAFGTDIIIEGTGDVHVHIVVNGKSILFCFRDSWHVPSPPHHFLSASRAISLGNQIMIAGRSPRMIFLTKSVLLNQISLNTCRLNK